MSTEEERAYNRAKAKRFYDRHKDDPAFKARHAALHREHYHNGGKAKVLATNHASYLRRREKVLATNARYKKTHQTMVLAKAAQRYQEKKEEIKAYTREYNRRNKAIIAPKKQIAARKQRYGLSDEAFKEMLLQQNYSCALCGGVSAAKRSLAVDHDHTSGKVRKLLCALCNLGLGHAKDSPEVIRLAALYLERHS
jgi:SLT domain-containing protein